ncbi:MAG TPA: His/Gly/Thr/Pro-type tRNA ligase C-terminal domain-containing protein, partial [Magnetospirillaceae bacterium]|nr:His/Gly/Thr/Pro-type tRNA ligase C-terminal domain-containing protein [Magnetospirillaceae bacterium]
YTRRKLEKQIKAAYDNGARFAIIVGGDERAAGEATIQDLQTRERRRIKISDVADTIAAYLQAPTEREHGSQ